MTKKVKPKVEMLSFEEKTACGHCGELRKHHCTLAVPFKVGEGEPGKVKMSGQVYEPLTPVCRNHLLLFAERVK